MIDFNKLGTYFRENYGHIDAESVNRYLNDRKGFTDSFVLHGNAFAFHYNDKFDLIQLAVTDEFGTQFIYTLPEKSVVGLMNSGSIHTIRGHIEKLYHTKMVKKMNDHFSKSPQEREQIRAANLESWVDEMKSALIGEDTENQTTVITPDWVDEELQRIENDDKDDG